MFLEPLGDAVAYQALDRRADLGGHQLILGLGRELGVGDLDREHAGEPFAGVLAAQLHLLPLGRAGALGIGRDHPGEGGAEGRQMGAPVALGDVVGEAQHGLVVAVVPPQREVDLDLVAPAADDERRLQERSLGLVQVTDERLHPALVVEDLLERLGVAQVAEIDHHAGVEERQLAQAMLQRFPVELDVGEGRQRGQEGHFRPGQELAVLPPRRRPDDAQGQDGVAAFKAHLVGLAGAMDAQHQPVGEGIDDRDADAVEAAGDLVGILVEFSPGV